MKVDEVKLIKSDDCDLCMLHTKVKKDFPIQSLFECPHCGKDQERYCTDFDEFTVVGETNVADPKEQIGLYPKFECGFCGGHIALMPVAILWNANHDIFYTGGKRTLPDWYKEDELIKAMMPSAEQFVRRLKAGEKLEAWTVACWLSRDAQKYLAGKLYEAGLKK